MKKKLCDYLLVFCGTLLLVACNCSHDESKLSLSASEVTFDYLGGEKEITLYSECSECGDPIPWEITSKIPSFLNVAPLSGSGTVTVTLTAEMSQSDVQESVSIQFNNGGETYLRVIQEPNPTVECYAEPIEVLDMSKGIACGVKIGNSCTSYYIALYEESKANMLSDDELREDIKKKSDKMYYPNYPENSPDGRYGTDYQDVLAWYHEIHPNTKYVIVTSAYTSDGEEGAVYRIPVTTKNDKYQPEVVLSEITPETTNNGDFWKWTTSMGGYNCKCYLVYACVSEELFPSFQRDDNGVVLAWKIHQNRRNLQKDNVLNVNFNSASNAAKCREFIFPKLMNSTDMVDLPRKSYDKYLEVVILAYDSDNFETAEPSGIVTDVKLNIGDESTPNSELDMELNGFTNDVCMDEGYTPTLNINTYSLSFTAAPETKSLTLTGDDSWNVISKPTWCTVNPNSGVGNSTINVTLTKNTVTEKRTGSIVIEGGGSQKRLTVSVTQEPGGETTIGKEGFSGDINID